MIYTCFFGYIMEYKMSLISTIRAAPAAAGSLICKAVQLELVEANLPDLGSCATPVVPELGGKGK
jgi:hypothetical protein